MWVYGNNKETVSCVPRHSVPVRATSPLLLISSSSVPLLLVSATNLSYKYPSTSLVSFSWKVEILLYSWQAENVSSFNAPRKWIVPRLIDLLCCNLFCFVNFSCWLWWQSQSCALNVSGMAVMATEQEIMVVAMVNY